MYIKYLHSYERFKALTEGLGEICPSGLRSYPHPAKTLK